MKRLPKVIIQFSFVQRLIATVFEPAATAATPLTMAAINVRQCLVPSAPDRPLLQTRLGFRTVGSTLRAASPPYINKAVRDVFAIVLAHQNDVGEYLDQVVSIDATDAKADVPISSVPPG